jgi:hypothetical protein
VRCSMFASSPPFGIICRLPAKCARLQRGMKTRPGGQSLPLIRCRPVTGYPFERGHPATPRRTLLRGRPLAGCGAQIRARARTERRHVAAARKQAGRQAPPCPFRNTVLVPPLSERVSCRRLAGRSRDRHRVTQRQQLDFDLGERQQTLWIDQ